MGFTVLHEGRLTFASMREATGRHGWRTSRAWRALAEADQRLAGY